VAESPRPMPATWPEQAVLGRFNVTTLFDTDDSTARVYQEGLGYIHLMEGKRERDIEERVKLRLAKENPAAFQRLERDTLVGPSVITHRSRVTPSTIRDFYRKLKPKVRPEKWSELPLELVSLTVTPDGLGDVIQLTDLCRSARAAGRQGSVTSPSLHFDSVMGFCPSYAYKRHALRVCLVEAVLKTGLGGGHNFQRIQRLFGLPTSAVPRGHLVVPDFRKIRGRVSLHTSAGRHAGWQREKLHPRARTLYPDTLRAIEELANDGDMTFIEVGARRTLHHPRIEDGTGDSVPQMIRLMAECEFHIGVLSGPTHVAAGLGNKVISIINFPHPGQLMLPNLFDTGVVEEDWLYPQSVILHQDEDSMHWPKFSRITLRAALNGEIYPYWDDSILQELHT